MNKVPHQKSETLEIPTPCGHVYVTICRDTESGEPIEVFARLGKSGGCASTVVNAVVALLSVGLKSGASKDDLIGAIESISCHRPPSLDQGQNIRSCVDAIAKALKESFH